MACLYTNRSQGPLYTVTFVERGLCGYGFEFDVHAISYPPKYYSNMTGSLFPFTSNPTMKLYAGRYWYGYHAYGSPFSGGEGNFTVSGPTTVYLNYSGVPANYCDNKQSINASALNSNAVNTTRMQNGTITGNTATIIVPSQNLTLTAGWSTRRISPLSIPMAQQVQPASYPVYIPVTITNNQSAPTPPGFQQQITIDAASFSQYERGDLGNMRFYYEGSELYSWCESGCSNASADTIFWVKLPSQIPAQSDITLDMVFEQPATGYDGVYAGEAPQLSPTYAEYDNGASVFSSYSSADAAALPSITTPQFPFIADGYITPVAGGENDVTYVPNGNITTNNVVLAASLRNSDGSRSGHYCTCYEDAIFYGNPYPNYADGGFVAYPLNPGSYYVDTLVIPDANAQDSYMEVDYNNNYSHTCAYLCNPPYYTTTGGKITSGQGYWLRTRLYPPNGVMPGVSLGQAEQCQGAAGTQAAAGALGAPICTTATSTTSTTTSTSTSVATTTIPPTPTICSWFCSGYQVTFTETGLPEGGLLCFISLCSVPQWTVTLDGVSQSSTGTSMSFYAQDGTYSYNVSSLQGYIPTKQSGTVNVNNDNPAPVGIDFVPATTYEVTFTESGLPLGPGWCWPFWACSTPQWSVGFDGVSQASTGTSMSFYAQGDGTYTYTITPPSGYPSSPGFGAVTVNNQAPNPITVSFNTQTNVPYDEQLLSTFTAPQNYNIISYTVNAVAQQGPHGYGPAYLVNGLTNAHYWYQLGLYYNWPGSSGGPGFYMEYEVWTSPAKTLPPMRVDFSGPVIAGDKIQLTLSFLNGNVEMEAKDLNTGAIAIPPTGFIPTAGTTFEEGSDCTNNGCIFTGLMTEEYHVNPYYGTESQVEYLSVNPQSLGAATIAIDERGVSGFRDSELPSPVYTPNPSKLWCFTYNNAVIESTATEFITGGQPTCNR